MRNIYKVATAMLCTGVLLGGIGTGVAIAEYSSLEYSGEHFFGAENMVTESFEVTVVPEEGKQIELENDYHLRQGDIIYDETIPENTVRYEVTYNPDLMKIRLRYDSMIYEDSYEPEDKEPVLQGHIRSDYIFTGNEFDIFMKNKNQILADIKDGKIGTYQTKTVDSVKVRMNPQLKGIVVWRF